MLTLHCTKVIRMGDLAAANMLLLLEQLIQTNAESIYHVVLQESRLMNVLSRLAFARSSLASIG